MSPPPLQRAPSLIVFYNTRCPVCDYGITWQASRLRAAVQSGDISFRDINVEPQALSTFGVTLEDIRRITKKYLPADKMVISVVAPK